MALLNYTTRIDVSKTLGEIQRQLVSHGANAILNEYDNQGYITSLSFKMNIDGNDIGFKLPADWRPVLKILENDSKVPQRLCTQEQALRVAWRIIKDWVEAQMAIVETKMVTVDQVFLPYAIANSGRTLYETVIENKLLLNSGE